LKSVKEIELEIVKEFEIFDSWMDRYEYIIDLGMDLRSFHIGFLHPRGAGLHSSCSNAEWTPTVFENHW